MIPALMAAGFAAQALGTGINAYRSNKFMNEAQRQLRDLENNPIEPYKASTQLRTAYAGARAGAAAPRGMSMEEVNRFMINQARNENTALANAGKMGYGGRGNLAVLNAGLSGMSADLASKSAMMAERNRQADLGRLQGLSSTYQTLANMNANANMQAQAAYGRAIQQQRQNISGAWKSLADAGGMAAGYGMMATGAPKKVPIVTPDTLDTTAPSVQTAVKGATGPGNNWLWDYSPDKQMPQAPAGPTMYQMSPTEQSMPAVTSDPLFNPAINKSAPSYQSLFPSSPIQFRNPLMNPGFSKMYNSPIGPMNTNDWYYRNVYQTGTQSPATGYQLPQSMYFSDQPGLMVPGQRSGSMMGNPFVGDGYDF